MQYIGLYLLLINLLGACAVVRDKRRARKNAWRVPERRLFAYCVLGGCPGVYAAMRGMRHKTLHRRFMWGIPAIFAVQLALCSMMIYFWIKGGGRI